METRYKKVMETRYDFHTYLLLYRIERRYSLWIAALITVMALGFGVMNLLAGIHNVQVAGLFS